MLCAASCRRRGDCISVCCSVVSWLVETPPRLLGWCKRWLVIVGPAGECDVPCVELGAWWCGGGCWCASTVGAIADRVACSSRAWVLELMWAATALCTCCVVQVCPLKWWSFLAFHIYHSVNKILWKRASVVWLEIRLCKMSWTPSLSWGRLSALIEGVKEVHTIRGRLQWKKRWASFSTAPQVEQWLSILVENLAARSDVASARRMSLQVKVLMMGGRSLLLHALCKMSLAWGSMLREPCWGSWTVFWVDRYL